MNNIILGAIGDYRYEQIAPWVNSINQSGFTGRKILLSYNSNGDLIKKLIKNGIEVYSTSHDSFGNRVDNFLCNTGHANKDNTDQLVHHIRFWHAYQLLNELGTQDIGWVLHTDVRDCIFQTNPDEWLNRFTSKQTIIAQNEYLTFGEETFNKNQALNSFGNYVYEYVLKDSLVYNVGSWAARVDTFVDVCVLLYELCYRRNSTADQAALALLLSTVYKDRVYSPNTQEAFALQCAIMHEQHHKYKDNIRGTPATIKNEMIVNENEIPYCIVHQWDRVPEFNKVITEKYII